MSTPKVAVVTGANKGIGLAIAKGLCEKFQGVVYLTARDETRGKTAVAALQKLGLKPEFHQLDVTDQSSINKLRDHLAATHGGLDVLINNAGIAFKNDASDPFSVQAEVTLGVNYFGQLDVCKALFPILRNNARVVNVSSSLGRLAVIPSETLRSKLNDPKLTVPQLNELMHQFIQNAKNSKHKEAGWGASAYSVSKVGLSALTKIQQRQFDEEKPHRNVSVNSVHPGYVDTDMTSHAGPLTVEQGAKAPLFLALEADNLKGKYVWFNCEVVDWGGSSTPTPY